MLYCNLKPENINTAVFKISDIDNEVLKTYSIPTVYFIDNVQTLLDNELIYIEGPDSYIEPIITCLNDKNNKIVAKNYKEKING